MKKFLCSVLLCGMAALPAISQGGGAAQTPPTATPTDPLATFVKGSFKQISTNLIGSAEQMPEENFSMKLGTTPEVRTFAAMIGHVINANFFFCSQAKGEAAPKTPDYERDTTAQSKDTLVKAMHAAIDYCASAYDSLTDATAMQMVTPQGPNGPGRPQLRVAILMRNVGHNNEEYGNLVGYFRTKNLVPPSTAAAASGGRRGN
jgi:DinB family protein